MAFKSSIRRCRFDQSGGQIIQILAAVLLFGLALTGCTGQAGASANLPTLVPTLSLGGEVNMTVTPSPAAAGAVEGVAFAPFPTDTPPAEAPVAGTVTDTITPWPTNSATPGPSPTPSRTPTRTRIPTRTIAPTRTPTITETPTITYTPTPPPPTILIAHPGLLSKLLSPIQLELYGYAGGNGVTKIELVGEDGRIIAGEDINRGANRSYYALPTLAFTIGTAAEMARLQVSTADRFGRLEALSSVDVILLQVGRNEIFPSNIVMEPYLIRQPRERATVSGGKVVLQGLARPINDSPIIIELVSESNTILGSTLVSVPQPVAPSSHTPYTVEIPYQVSDPTPARLIIRQEGSRIPGTVALNSISLTLTP